MTKSQSSAHVHKMIAKVAQEMCFALYEELMTRDEWYRDWKAKHPGASSRGLAEAFVKKNWARYIEQSRATLAGLLSQPIDDVLKEQIADALVLDKSLVKGRASPGQVIGHR